MHIDVVPKDRLEALGEATGKCNVAAKRAAFKSGQSMKPNPVPINGLIRPVLACLSFRLGVRRSLFTARWRHAEAYDA